MTALGTRALTIKVGGTDFSAQVSNCTIEAADADSDFTTFADAAAGGAKAWTLKFTATQDMASTSLWSKMWTVPGTSVAYVLAPNGGATPSATQPTFSGNATVTIPDGTVLGGDADSSTTAKFSVDMEWPLDAKPTMAVT